MKLFNVHLEVQVSCIGELTEPPAPKTEESFVDLVESADPGSDPMKMQAKVLDKLYNKIGGDATRTPVAMFPSFGFPSPPEGVTMSQNVKIAASSFEELQKILAKFHEVAEALQVPA